MLYFDMMSQHFAGRTDENHETISDYWPCGQASYTLGPTKTWLSHCTVTYGGDRGSTVVKVLCYKSEGSWFDSSWCHWIFHWHKILPIALWPWGRQKWVPGVFPGGKGGRCVRLTTLPPSCAVVTKSGNLIFLEPSGPVQACNGTALPLPLLLPMDAYVFNWSFLFILLLQANNQRSTVKVPG